MKCPTCFRGLPAAPEYQACLACEAPKSALLNQEYGGRDVTLRYVFPSRDDGCPRCKAERTPEACQACHSVIPDEFRFDGTRVTCLAMAGARSSGKSIYLGVLKHELERWVEEAHGSVLGMIGATESHYWQRYGAPLFDGKVILGPTAELSTDPEGHIPLIFRFRDVAGPTQIVVVRDVAGEDLENLAQRRTALAFVERADAVVALIDPLKMDRLRESLNGVIHAGALGGDGVDVVAQVIDLLTGDGRREVAPGTRLAVAVSKVDVLQRVRDVPGAPLRPAMLRSGSPLQRVPGEELAHFDPADADLLDAEVDSLMTLLVGKRLGNLLDQSGLEHRFFAVSALGAHPEGQRLNSVGIAPFRVLDPLKWVLS